MPRVSSPEFKRALVVPKYDFYPYENPIRIDSDVRALFGEEWVLGAEEIIRRWAALARMTFPGSSWSKYPEGCIVTQHCEGAGTLFHQAVRNALVTQEADPDGEPLWRLVRREPTFVASPHNRYICIRVRGLPPEEQAAQHAREQRQARLTATLDRNARERADVDIQHLVSCMVRDGADAVASELPFLKKHLPEIAHGRSVGEVSPMIADAHHRLGMSRPELRAWINELGEVTKRVHRRVEAPPLPLPPVRIMRGAGPGILADFALGPLPPIAPALPPREPVLGIPAEDQASLFDLAP